MADINSYALNLSFNISTNADAIFSGINDQLTAIEQQIESVSQAASSAFDFSGAVTSAAAINAELTRTTTNLRGVSRQSDTITNELNEQSDISAILNKNFSRNNEELKKTSGILKTVTGGLTGFAKLLGGTALASFTAGLWEVITAEKEMNDLSRRIYGDHNEMASQLSRLTLETQVFGKHAKDAFMAVADQIRFTDDMLLEFTGSTNHLNRSFQDQEYRSKLAREALKGYAEHAAKVSKVTGVAAGTVVEWQKSLVAIGVNFGDTKKVMNGMVSAMKAAGMTSEDITKLLNRQSSEAVNLNIVYGKDGVVAINKYRTNMAAAFKHMGLDAEAANEIVTTMFTDVNAQALLLDEGKTVAQRMGLDPKQLGDVKLIQIGLEKMIGDLEADIAAGGDSTDKNIMLQRLNAVLQTDPKTFGAVQTAFKKMGGVTDDAAKKYLVDKGHMRMMKLDQLYADATDSISNQLAKFGETFVQAWQLIVRQFAPYIKDLIKQLMPLADIFGNVALWIDDFNAQAKELDLSWPEYFGELFRTIGAEIMGTKDAGPMLKKIGEAFIWLGDNAERIIEDLIIWWNEFSTSAMQAWTDFEGIAGWIVKTFEFIGHTIEILGMAWTGFWTGLSIGGKIVSDIFWMIWDAAGSFFTGIMDGIASMMPSWLSLEDIFVGGIFGMSGSLTDLFGLLGDFDKYIGDLLGLSKGFFGSISHVVTSFWNSFKLGWAVITKGSAAAVREATAAANKEAANLQKQSSKSIQRSTAASGAAHKRNVDQTKKANAAIMSSHKKRQADVNRSVGRKSRIDRSRLGLSAEDKKKKMEKDLQDAVDNTDTSKLLDPVKKTGPKVFKEAFEVMSLQDMWKARMRGMTHVDTSGKSPKAIRLTPKTPAVKTPRLTPKTPAVKTPARPQQPMKPEPKKSVAKAETITAPAAIHEDKMKKRRDQRDQGKSQEQNANNTKRLVEVMEKEEGTKELLQRIARALEQQGMNRPKASVGGSHVTEWAR